MSIDMFLYSGPQTGLATSFNTRARACVRVIFTITDRASTLPSNTRGCQPGMYSTGQENIRGKSSKLKRERIDKNELKTTKERKKTHKKKQKMPETIGMVKRRAGNPIK